MRKLRFVTSHNSNKSQGQSLSIIRQTSLLEETILKNDVTKVIHNVVKNSPFTITIAAAQPFDFANAQITAKLLYDTDDVDKEVPYLERRPLEYFSRPRENELVMEFRIHVLSSYHEGSLFKIRIDIFDPNENRTYTLYSQSIRSVSKPEPLLRKREALEQETIVERPRKRKRDHETGDIIGLLKDLREGQEEQKNLLKQLLDWTMNPPSAASPVSVVSGPSPTDSTSPVLEKVKEEPVLDSMPFPELPAPPPFNLSSALEIALFNLVKAAQTYNSTERIRQIKQFIAEHPHYLQLLTDLMNEIHSSGVPITKGIDDLQSTGCLCVNCPYKQQLNQLEEFYVQYVSLPPPQAALTNNNTNGSATFRNNSIDF